MESNKELTSSPKKTSDFNSVFSLSVTDLKKKDGVTDKQIESSAIDKIKRILRIEFPNSNVKQQVDEKHGRLNFACPYCGDSVKNEWKKRGNLYLDDFYYHCYNCGEHTTYLQFLNDFKISVDKKHISKITEKIVNGKAGLLKSGTLNNHLFLDTSFVDKWAIDRKELIIKMGYQEIKGSKIENYLRKRLQMDFNKFAWNQKYQKLIIFNLTADGKKVLGFQIRNFKATPKYLTFKLDKIYQEILKLEIPDDETFEYANKLSNVFGIMNLNIQKPITAFEGPMDSFLLNNSVGMCSAKNDFPFDIPVRWFYDKDKTGIAEAMKRAKDGNSVFMWKKFLNDCNLSINRNKKIDLNDLIVHSIRKREPLKNFDDYFTKDKYDIYEL